MREIDLAGDPSPRPECPQERLSGGGAEEAGPRERQFRALIENLASGVALVDAAGRFSLYNARFLEMFGLAPDADIDNVNSTNWSAWGVYDERGQLLDVDDHPVRKAALTRQPVRNQTVGVRAPGAAELAWMVVSAEPLFSPDGSIENLICTYHDITERKRAEEALRASEVRFRSVLENMSEGVMLFDASGDLSYQNPASKRIHGFDLESDGRIAHEALPVTWNAWDDKGRAIGFDEWPVSRVFRGERFQNQILRVERVETGRVFHGSYNGSPILGQDGKIALGFITIRNITDEVHSATALREANERLQEADKRKNEFLGMLSHELRNPLSPIRNSVYILERATPGGDQARRALAVIDRQAAHMARLIDDLLDVTRISRGKIRLQREWVELNEVVHGTGEDLRPLFQANGIELELDISQQPLRALADRTRIAQVVGNLLQNAAKFTPRGGRVRLSLACGDDGHAVVRVRDSGVGIEPRVVERLFEAFVQADATLDRSKGGLGLGLALVKGLVELHEGSVSAHSGGPGMGAEFVVRLPLADAR